MTQRAVTLSDVARRAQVSKSTVSRALNGTATLSATTVQRVHRAIGELGYEPNRAARHLAGGRTGAIGIVVPDLTNPFFAAIARGAQRHAHAAGELTLIADSDARPAAEIALVERLAPDVDGILLCSPTAPTRALRAGLQGRAAVLVNRQIRGWPSVVADQAAAVTAAHAHVLELGHRRIAYVRGPASKWTSAVRDPVAARLGAVMVGPFEPTFAGGAAAAATLGRHTTAVLAHNDLVALGVVDALLRGGRRVPEDISVVGCDDVELASLVRPALTSVAMPLDELGRRGMALLLDRVGPAHDDPTPQQVLPVTLTRRHSTGPAPRRRR